MRNNNHDIDITQTLSQLGFLTDLERSHSIADWAYEQARINHHIFWKPK